MYLPQANDLLQRESPIIRKPPIASLQIAMARPIYQEIRARIIEKQFYCWDSFSFLRVRFKGNLFDDSHRCDGKCTFQRSKIGIYLCRFFTSIFLLRTIGTTKKQGNCIHRTCCLQHCCYTSNKANPWRINCACSWEIVQYVKIQWLRHRLS